MYYCNNACNKMKQCKNHIIHQGEGVYNVKSLHQEDNKCFEQISCALCGEAKRLFGNGMCHSCYQQTNVHKWKGSYVPTGKKRGRPPKADYDNIVMLKENMTFQQIGEYYGISKQRAEQIYKKKLNHS